MGGVEPLCPALMEDASARDRGAQTEVFTHSGDDSGWGVQSPSGAWAPGPVICFIVWFPSHITCLF